MAKEGNAKRKTCQQKEMSRTNIVERKWRWEKVGERGNIRKNCHEKEVRRRKEISRDTDIKANNSNNGDGKVG